MRRLLLLLTPALIAGSLSLAKAEVSYKGQTEAGIQGGGLFFEGDAKQKDVGVYGGRLGYYMTEHWGLEGAAVFGRTKNEVTKIKGDVWSPQLELQYHFGQSRLRPFLAAGPAFYFFAPDRTLTDTSNFAASVGGGLKWMVCRYSILRLDARDVINTETGRGTHNALLTAGLSVLFGAEEAPQPAPVAKVEAPVAKVVESAAPKVVDSDGDGVPDNLDKCPNTPAGVKVDANGCPLDSDGDGVADYLDKCPDTPKGVAVDAKGCPKDSDGDGVPDYKDDCEGTPAGTKVDEHGCPQEVKAIPTDNWVLEGVTFNTGSDQILDAAKPALDEAAVILKTRSKVVVEIQGHTDNVGKPEANLALSDRRAASVKNYLVEKGVPAERLQTKGYGETQPVSDNNSAKGRAKNRRIAFKVLSK